MTEETNTQTQTSETTNTNTEQSSVQNWLDVELEELESQQTYTGERKPSVKFEENKVSEIDVDISEPWSKWEDQENNATKAIIPCTQKGEECIWWLNVKNPIYKEIVRKARDGQTHLKIMQTGSGKATRYHLVEEDGNQ